MGARLRAWDVNDCATHWVGDRAPPGKLRYPKYAGRFAVEHVRDLTEGYDSSSPEGKPTLPTSRSSHMITFTFKNKAVVTLRTSGTEPKLKYYSDLAKAEGLSAAEAELAELVEA